MTLSTTEGHSGQRGGAQSINVVNEPGLYRLIFQSRKPEAEALKTWEFTEVLPQIRKTGKYEHPALPEAEPVYKTLSAAKIREFRLSCRNGFLTARQFQKVLELPEDSPPPNTAPIPELSPRTRLNQTVSEYVRLNGGGVQTAWSKLYREFKYRYHRDIVFCAKNRKLSVLDYAEHENLVEDLLSLALFIFNNEVKEEDAGPKAGEPGIWD
jgi:hypothetical protein